MNIDDVYRNFLIRFPQLENEIRENIKTNLIDGDDGIYVVWGLGVMPCVVNLITNAEIDEEPLHEIFDFFEEMAISDEKVKELLIYSTLESLGDNKEILSKSMNYMKEETRLLSKKVEEFLGR